MFRSVDGHDMRPSPPPSKARAKLQAFADCLPDDDRQGRADDARVAQDPRRAARGKEEIAAGARSAGWPYEPFTGPAGSNPPGSGGRVAGPPVGNGRSGIAAARNAAAFDRTLSGALPDNVFAQACGLPQGASPKGNQGRHPQGFADGARGDQWCDALTIGGSADLTGSNLTQTSQDRSIRPKRFKGRYIHYGIREHAMAAAMNGSSLHGGFIPYGGTFLVSSDYARGASGCRR
jgi:transketolase